MHLQKTKLYIVCNKTGCTFFTCKHLLLFLCFSMITVLSQAQTQKLHTPVAINPAQDKITYQNFIIRLIPTVDGYYGFDILRNDKLVLHQTKSPLPGFGLTYKEDAFTTARWLINEYRKNGRFPHVFPPGFERQLQSSQPAQPINQ